MVSQGVSLAKSFSAIPKKRIFSILFHLEITGLFIFSGFVYDPGYSSGILVSTARIIGIVTKGNTGNNVSNRWCASKGVS
jgi:hypothetical protein